MIVVDSSVWIARLRETSIPPVQTLGKLIISRAPILVADAVLLEILQGARDDRHAQRLEQDLRQFPIVQVLNTRLAIAAARNARLLRAHGVTIRKTVDLILGTFCLEHGHTLLHDDRDFTPMATHLGLQIA